MAWQAYKIVLRLRSPLHIGRGKVGNLQRTRPYVAGRNLWGALTARLTRDADADGNPDPKAYQKMGKRVHEELAFTYFFPTTEALDYAPLFPHLTEGGAWGYGQNGDGAPRLDAATFGYRFLSTYAGTALNYDVSSVEEASLHEVECLLPHTRAARDAGLESEPVYLTGYLFQREDATLAQRLDWRGALTRLQIGGERGYGWGHVTVAAITEIEEVAPRPIPLFETGHTVDLAGEAVRVRLRAGRPLLAHALGADFSAEHRAVPAQIRGPVTPLVGRETTPKSRFGVRLSQARVCYAPGARVQTADKGMDEVIIGPYGVWEGTGE